MFGVSTETVPWDEPYVPVPNERFAPNSVIEATGLKIGVVWAGSPTRAQDRYRSVAASRFAPLTTIDDVSVFSLQVGPTSGDCPEGIHDLTEFIGDFSDTAAIVASLDLVISVDTSVAHLAGAMGKPVWVLMSQPRGYFWLSAREDTPWYPSLRIIEQSEPGDWEGVFAQVHDRVLEEVKQMPRSGHNPG